MRGLYVFTHDCRLQDNALLQHISHQCDELICLYILDSRILHRTRFQTQGLGIHRQRFLLQSLNDLSRNLAERGQRLIIQVGDSQTLIPRWVKRYSIDQVAMTFHPGVYEQELRDYLLTSGIPLVTHKSAEQFTLLTQGLLPMEIHNLSCSFSQFRKQVEAIFDGDYYQKTYLTQSYPRFDQLPPLPTIANHEDSHPLPFDADKLLASSGDFVGGESRALQQMAYYFQPDRLDHYKETRNGLTGWDFSSKLSPWLALGCLSPRRVWQEVNTFEQQYGANDSSYWLKFELLWREYFQWLLLGQGKRFFRFSGLRGKRPLTSFYPEHFKAWVEGTTGYRGVDAAMKQLKQQGWMSNRARQWAASCLVNELSVDWRFGAAYFEEQLIDFDVASNWGNWLYLAGVGTDPRGSRQFNLEKQLAVYDPEDTFCNYWLEASSD